MGNKNLQTYPYEVLRGSLLNANGGVGRIDQRKNLKLSDAMSMTYISLVKLSEFVKFLNLCIINRC